MDSTYQKKHIFLTFAVLIAVFAPIFYFFFPQTIADILHNKNGVWFVSVPSEAFTAFLIGSALLIIASLVLFILDIRKLSIIISGLFLSLAIGSFFLSSQAYLTLSDENISYSSLFSLEKNTYSWDEVTEVIHFRTELGDISEYEFVFNDQNTVRIDDTSYFKAKAYNFGKKLATENLTIGFSLMEEE